MHVHQIVTLADVDVMKVIMTILVPAIWLIAQLMSGRDQAKRRPPAKAPPKPVPLAPKQGGAPVQPGGQPKPNSLEEALRREVDDFMRRAQGKPAREKRDVQQTKQPFQRRLKITPAAETLGRPNSQGAADQQPPPGERRPLSQPISEMGGKLPSELAKAGASAADPLWGDNVADHVAQHLGGDRLQVHAEQLGEEVAQSDERMEEHLHSVFDHQLGSFSTREAAPASRAQRPTLATDVRDLIRQPGGMRKLIIANEILRRPVDRL